MSAALDHTDITADRVLDSGHFKDLHPEPFSEVERERFRTAWREVNDILWPKFQHDPEGVTLADLNAAFRQVAVSWGAL